MNNSAQVSIIIPSFNHKKYIMGTLESIKKQTYKNIKTFVIDDGSTDGSPEYLKSLKSKYDFELVLKNNEGLCATINKGLELCSGEYIVIIASDDSMPVERIQQQVDLFNSYDCDVISGGMTLIDEDSHTIKYVKPLKIGLIKFDEMLNKNLIYAPTVMFRSEVFKKFGKYNQKHLIEDYSMWLRILHKGGCIINFDKNWANYRVNHAISRRKIDWYFKGLSQVFSEYADNPKVQKALERKKIIYLIKVAIFDGKNAVSFIKVEKEKISQIVLIFIYLLALLPAFVRGYLKKFANKA